MNHNSVRWASQQPRWRKRPRKPETPARRQPPGAWSDFRGVEHEEPYTHFGWCQLMGRKNRRDQYEPADLTPAPHDPVWDAGHRATREQVRERERQAAIRQREAKLNRGIDWSACLVPGCGKRPSFLGRGERDHTKALPLCANHLSVACVQGDTLHRAGGLIADATVRYLAYRDAQERARIEAEKRDHLARTDGMIYFVRLNGLIKAGWSRDLRSRLRAYGPDVEVLAHFPGTRDDETNLHRHLRPNLAKGREWYHDNAAVRRFVDEAVARHGEPVIEAFWTEPAAPAPRPRGSRAA